MRGAALTVLLSPVLLLSLVSSAIAWPQQQPRPDKNIPEPNSDCGGVAYDGKVTALTRDTITLEYGDDKPKTFTVSGTLAAGDIPMQARPIPGRARPYHVSPTWMYRFTDVKVGDWVELRYSKVGGVVTCDHITIRKRP